MNQQVFTEAQSQAIQKDGSIAVLAGAGSGKTRVLIERCKRLLFEKNISFDRFLIMTFTEKAAGELKERLRPLLSPQDIPLLERAWIGTFHSFCARVLRLHAPLLKLDPSFHILEENRADFMIHQLIDQTLFSSLEHKQPEALLLMECFGYRNTVQLLEELMGFRWHVTRYLSQGQDDVIRACFTLFQAVEKKFQQQLQKERSLDFQELERYTLTLFQEHPSILREYQKRFLHLLVDEFQDTNDLQTELITLLFHPKINHLFIVGDPRQSIYRFRGANLTSFFTMISRIRESGGELIALSENFRTRPHIIDLINITARPLEENLSLHADLRPFRKERDQKDITLLQCHTSESSIAERRHKEATCIAAHIRELVDVEHIPYGNIVCLFQAMTSIDIYEQAFQQHQIPYRIHGSRHFLGSSEIQDLLCTLLFAANPKNDTALMGLVRSPLLGLSDDECVLLSGKEGKDFRKNILHHAHAGPFLKKLSSLQKSMLPSEILSWVLQTTGYEWICAQLDPSGKKRAHLEQFLTLLRSLETESFLSLPACVDYLQDLCEREARFGDAPASADSSNVVHCMSVHAAKGLEFPIVILPDLIRRASLSTKPWCFIRNRGLGLKLHNPDSPFDSLVATKSYEELHSLNNKEEEQESRRLLYVAMTRAKDRLILPIHQDEKIRGEWHGWLLPALKQISAFTVNTQLPENEEKTFSREKVELPLTYKVPKNTSRFLHQSPIISVSEIETYDRSPEEYEQKYIFGFSPELTLPNSETLSPTLYGSLLHEALEILSHSSTDSIATALTDACHSHHLIPEASWMSSLTTTLEPFMTTFGTQFCEGEHELRFDWKRKDSIITGKVDWLRPKNGGYEIIDFKTDRTFNGSIEEHAKMYDLQMIIYALALEEGLGLSILETTLYFLETGKTISTPMTVQRKKEGKKRLAAILKKMCGEFIS